MPTRSVPPASGCQWRGRLIEAHTTTAWRWVKTAVKRAEELGAISPGKQISTHTLPPQLRTAPADERHPDQLPITLARTLFNTDYAHLPGACAGPYGQPGDGAMMDITGEDILQPHILTEERVHADEGTSRPEELRHEPCGVHEGLAGWRVR